MTVVIPLGDGSSWDNKELMYCLRSLEANLRMDFQVVLLADTGCVPDFINTDTVKVYERDRFYPDGLEEFYGSKRFENYFSVQMKIRDYVEINKDKEGDFLLSSDDIVLLKEVDNIDVFKGIAMSREKKYSVGSRVHDRHGETISESIRLLGPRKNLYNFSTHLIRAYNYSNLASIYVQFPIQNQKIPFELASLYYNLFTQTVTQILDENNTILCRADCDSNTWTSTRREILQGIEGRTVLNYTDKALFKTNPKQKDVYPLQSFLKETFPDPCKFELLN